MSTAAVISVMRCVQSPIDFERLAPTAIGGVVVATTTYAIADHPKRIAPQIGHDAVRQILRTAKLDADLIDTLWKP